MARPFRFDAATHTYYLGQEPRPHITGMLQRGGWVDDRWFTEESCERGRQAHALTAAYDLGAVDLASCRSGYRGYLLTHAKAIGLLAPTFDAIEEPAVHPEHGFGGRPDREMLAYGLRAVLEGKSGQEDAKAHGIQTALQAILVAPKYNLPAEAIARFVLYWKLGERKDGSWRWKLYEQTDGRDYAEAYRLIRAYC